MPSKKKELGVSQALNANVRKYGREILCNLTIALRTSKLYSFSHQNVVEAIQQLQAIISEFLRLESTCRFARSADNFFLNEVRIKPDSGTYQSIQHILPIWSDRDLGEVEFLEGITQGEIESLVKVLNLPLEARTQRWEAFFAAASQFETPRIVLRNHKERKDIQEHDPPKGKTHAIGSFFKAINAMERLLEDDGTTSQGTLIKKLRNLVHSFTDLTLDEEHSLVALTNVKGHGKPGCNHAVNVAILSVATGVHLGLGKKLLADLGMAALLHDVGKAQLPASIRAQNPFHLKGSSLAAYRTHVQLGVEWLLKQRLNDAIVKGVTVAFLHHQRYDRTGYPKVTCIEQQNLNTRIVAVVDFYDNATTYPGADCAVATPEEALRKILDGAGTEFDPIVVKAFVNLMGLYPVGCMVRLDTGEVATVIAPPTNPRHPDRPIVRVIGPLGDRESAYNLLDRSASGGFARSILKLFQQQEVQLELDEYLSVI